MDVQEILKQMTPEHAKVIQDSINASAASLKEAQDNLASVTKERDEAQGCLEATQKELAEAKTELEEAKTELEEAKESAGSDNAEKDKQGSGNTAFDQTETFKSMPKEVQEYLSVIKQQKEAAEEELRKSREAAAEAEAVAKAAELKAIPVDKEKLVGILKNADKEVVELLETINGAINSTVLGEVGKSAPDAGSKASASDAWAKIESKADELAKSSNISKAKAVSQVISENPDLYKEYLEGGAN